MALPQKAERIRTAIGESAHIEKEKIMKNRNIALYMVAVALVLLVSFTVRLSAEEKDKPRSTITLDWQEFSKLLKLDTDEIRLSWDEFSRLLEHTGFVFQPEYKMEGGDVILTREHFSRLIDALKPPKTVALAPPGDYIIRKARYEGKVGAKGTRFITSMDIHILKKDTGTYLKIPLFREELAIEEVWLDNRPASLITESGWHCLLTTARGHHEVSIKFSVASSLEGSTPGIRFSIPQTPITHLILDIPGMPLDIKVANVQGLQLTERDNHTIASCDLVPTQEVNVNWTRRVAEVTHGPAKVYAELYNLLSIEAAAIRVTTRAHVDILQSKIRSLTFSIPEGYHVLEVQGAGTLAWNTREEQGNQLLDVAFEYPLEGTHSLIIKTEKLIDKETTIAEFSGIAVLDVMRESGFVAGEVQSDAEAHVQEFNGLDRIDYQQIPDLLSTVTTRPLQFAFKYTRHPYKIVVDIVKYKKEEALSGIIDNATGISFISEDGKLVHQVTFTMQNMWNQFLKVALPEHANIWSVYVDGNREKPSRDDDGKILIPLPRSRKEGNVLSTFDVELIYSEPVPGLSLLGRRSFSFPTPDVIMNRMQWRFYMPEDYRYFHFTGNLKPSKETEDITTTMPESAEITAIPEDAKKAAPVSGRDISGILKGTAGLLSIRVNIPLSGNTFLLTKQFIEKGEKPQVTFSYMDRRLIHYGIALAVLIIASIFLKLRGRFLGPLRRLALILPRTGPFWKRCLQPKVLILLLIFALGIAIFREFYLDYPLIFWLLVLGFIASLAQLMKTYTERDMRLLWHPIVVMALLFFMLPLVAFASIFRTWEFFTLGLVMALLVLAIALLLVKTIRATMLRLSGTSANKPLKE
jgi:hypothetical protein